MDQPIKSLYKTGDESFVGEKTFLTDKEDVD